MAEVPEVAAGWALCVSPAAPDEVADAGAAGVAPPKPSSVAFALAVPEYAEADAVTVNVLLETVPKSFVVIGGLRAELASYSDTFEPPILFEEISAACAADKVNPEDDEEAA